MTLDLKALREQSFYTPKDIDALIDALEEAQRIARVEREDGAKQRTHRNRLEAEAADLRARLSDMTHERDNAVLQGQAAAEDLRTQLATAQRETFLAQEETKRAQADFRVARNTALENEAQLATAREEMEPEFAGTFNCPICGRAFPHGEDFHLWLKGQREAPFFQTPEMEEAARDARIPAAEKALRAELATAREEIERLESGSTNHSVTRAVAIREAAEAVRDTDVEVHGRSYTREDDGAGTLRAAAANVEKLAPLPATLTAVAHCHICGSVDAVLSDNYAMCSKGHFSDPAHLPPGLAVLTVKTREAVKAALELMDSGAAHAHWCSVTPRGYGCNCWLSHARSALALLDLGPTTG